MVSIKYSFLGRQTISGGGDPHMWYRSISVAPNGNAYYKDHNDYAWPGGGGDPVAEITNMDWTIDNYWTITVWAELKKTLNLQYTLQL